MGLHRDAKSGGGHAGIDDKTVGGGRETAETALYTIQRHQNSADIMWIHHFSMTI